MYGETSAPSRSRDCARGLSPHVRGNRPSPYADAGCGGSIPACTGKPARWRAGRIGQRVYPRMYGETSERSSHSWRIAGLSPHVRGNRSAPPRSGPPGWSIPACTGKPHERRARAARCRVYPRMYGETGRPRHYQPPHSGLSPHVRGNPAGGSRSACQRRSIPACTGKPRREPRRQPPPVVYPRMYGETRRRRLVTTRNGGLSPHVRGNLPASRDYRTFRRSIPACTGKPSTGRPAAPSSGVYPRMYGETRRAGRSGPGWRGLSPHVRGNPEQLQHLRIGQRSIPACTGKPHTQGAHARYGGVYPRMYGETAARDNLHTLVRGLSPHVRGNLGKVVVLCDDWRSIPACTGKPLRGVVARRGDEVYPRMYGETDVIVDGDKTPAGLSPHVRGNHSQAIPVCVGVGSIPACTGKPNEPHPPSHRPRVYPRMYGETEVKVNGLTHRTGLSPHVRGNLFQPESRHPVGGSIPACTGKPPCRPPSGKRQGVYPRMYGETSRRSWSTWRTGGLSPHVRGNRGTVGCRRRRRGSIPACTGKPSARCL